MKIFISQILGKKNYDKFIIITRSRTGSNLLISLMNDHPNVKAFGELFKNTKIESSEAIWNRLFRKYIGDVKWVGCKIFYYHPLQGDDQIFWSNIKADANIHIIHLTRENRLKTLVSRKIAVQTDQWMQDQEQKVELEDKRISLTKEECLEEFNKIEQWEKDAREEWSDHPYIELSYETLTEDKNGEINKVFDFLKVPNSSVNSGLKKQNKEGLNQLIKNYDALKKEFENTPWIKYFDA